MQSEEDAFIDSDNNESDDETDWEDEDEEADWENEE